MPLLIRGFFKQLINMSVNYMRVLHKVKCKYCGHECHDIDMEQFESTNVDEHTSIITFEMICPKCNETQDKEKIYSELKITTASDLVVACCETCGQVIS